MKEKPLPLILQWICDRGKISVWDSLASFGRLTQLECFALLREDLELKSLQIGNITTPGTRKHTHGIR